MRRLRGWWRRFRNPFTDREMRHLLWKCEGSTQCVQCDDLIPKLKELLGDE